MISKTVGKTQNVTKFNALWLIGKHPKEEMVENTQKIQNKSHIKAFSDLMTAHFLWQCSS